MFEGNTNSQILSCGADGFAQHYRQLFGPRWLRLCCALQQPRPQLNLRQLACAQTCRQYGLPPWTAPLWLSPGLELPDYWLDPASYWLSCLLPIRAETPQVRVWDMCAAPGGKMLALALRLQEGAQLLASDVSPARFCRLLMQRQRLPQHTGPQIVLQNRHACQLALRYKALDKSQQFDAILLDAPCSSERHVLQSAALLLRWKASRSRRNAQGQLALLCSALDCLAPGGYLLYATCALSPLENAAVMARALQKRPHLLLRVVSFDEIKTMESLRLPPDLPWQLEEQPKGLGYHILPDRNQGCGPLYFCLLQREGRQQPTGTGVAMR